MKTIHCNSIENIIWNEHEKSSPPFVLSEGIHIWRVFISSNLNLINQFENILSPDEYTRAIQYYQEKDRQRFLISRIILRKLLSNYSNQLPGEIKFAEGLNKKPFVENLNLSDLHFNISHSADMIMIAIAPEEVGVDVEKINANFSYKEILPQNFSDEEIRFIKKPEDFYLLWTRKEALLKATGKGIDDDLPRVPSLDGIHHINVGDLGIHKNWIIKSFQAEKDYTGSIAYNSEKQVLKFYDIML